MEDCTVNVDNALPETNYFIYDGKQFPFNITIFNYFSKYFHTNHIQIKPNSSINLINQSDHMHLTEPSIKDFINHCQNKPIKLTKDNISSLHKLAKKYMVDSLIKATEKFISDHHDELIIEFLVMNENTQNFDAELYEDTISRHFLYYIKKNQIFNLKINSLHRIMTKYQLNYRSQNNEQENTEVMNFIFKCIDHYGRRASSLLDNIDFSHESIDALKKLMNEPYSQIIDFHFINNSYHQQIYDMLSDVIRNETDIRTNQSDLSNQMRRENEELTREIAQLKEDISQLNSTVSDQNDVIQNLINQISELNKPKIHCNFAGSTYESGIIAYLQNKVEISAAGNKDPTYPLSNIRKHNNTPFYNYYGDASKNKSTEDSWIEFDFGDSIKIDLSSYFMCTNGNGKSCFYHQKSWRIVGSNNHIDWILLDKRTNDDSMNAPLAEKYFHCQEHKYGEMKNRFRYIRYVQDESWNENNFNVFITYIELYGDIYFN